jgi:hypothetical protein
MWRGTRGSIRPHQWRRNDPFASLEILEMDPLPAERESAARRLIPSASIEASARRCGSLSPRMRTSGSGGLPTP